MGWGGWLGGTHSDYRANLSSTETAVELQLEDTDSDYRANHSSTETAVGL